MVLVVVITNIIVVCLAYLSKYERNNFCLKLSFAILFLFLALRFDYGNDYMAYLTGFLEINNKSFSNSFENSYYEPGWIFLVRCFQPFGYFLMVAAISLFNCYVVYRFIKKYIPRRYYWYGVFIYVFNPGFMLVLSSALRQSIAISLFLISIELLQKKQILNYIIIVLLASQFHTSALILLPLCIPKVLNLEIGRAMIIVILMSHLSIIIFREYILRNINIIVSMYFTRYAHYSGGLEINTGIGMLYLSLQFLFVLIYAKYMINEKKILAKLAIAYYFFVPLGLLLMMIGRAGIYFEMSLIVVLPLVFRVIENKIVKIIFIGTTLAFILYSFFIFFESPVWRDSFNTYHTIFSANLWY